MGTWRRGILPQHIPVRTAWPLKTPTESDAGDFAILHAPPFHDFSKWNATIAEPEFVELEKEFVELYHQCIEGVAFDELRWKSWSNRMNLSYQTTHEITDPLIGETYIPIDYLSDLCEDYIPGLGLFATALIWGPFANKELPSPIRQLAGAICSTIPLLNYKHSPASKAFEQRPKLPLPIHQSLSSHCRYPYMIWAIEDGYVKPLLPLAIQYHPQVRVNNLPPSSFMIGKVIQIQNQWVAHFVLPLNSNDFLSENIQMRLQVEWLRAQRHCSTLFFEDILRERADILYRYAAEYLYETKPTEIMTCLDYYSSLVAP
jgi:hypothetical protein